MVPLLFLYFVRSRLLLGSFLLPSNAGGASADWVNAVSTALYNTQSSFTFPATPSGLLAMPSPPAASISRGTTREARPASRSSGRPERRAPGRRSRSSPQAPGLTATPPWRATRRTSIASGRRTARRIRATPRKRTRRLRRLRRCPIPSRIRSHAGSGSDAQSGSDPDPTPTPTPTSSGGGGSSCGLLGIEAAAALAALSLVRRAKKNRRTG